MINGASRSYGLSRDGLKVPTGRRRARELQSFRAGADRHHLRRPGPFQPRAVRRPDGSGAEGEVKGGGPSVEQHSGAQCPTSGEVHHSGTGAPAPRLTSMGNRTTSPSPPRGIREKHQAVIKSTTARIAETSDLARPFWLRNGLERHDRYRRSA